MAEVAANESVPLLPTLQADGRARTLAKAVGLASLLVFLALAPFTKTPLPALSAFIPIYESALLLNDLITAVMLFGHFLILKSRATLVLACAYLFTAVLIIPHALAFPGLFSATGWIGAGSQSTAWLYVFWHVGFPVCVIAYAILNRRPPAPLANAPRAALLAIGAVLASAAAATFLCTVGHDLLPPILVAGTYSLAGHVSLSTTWLCSAAALVVLWRLSTRSTLDLWLMVVLGAWLCDIGLSAVLNGGRYDLGWYAGRIFGLLAASYVLIVLLLESNKLFARLTVAHEQAVQRNAELQEARRYAEQANQAKSAFLSSMSHELRTPLNAILGFAQILASDKLPVTPEKRQEFNGHIYKAGKHLLVLINEVLDLAKIESGTLALSPEPVGLAELMEECRVMMAPLAERHALRLEVIVAAGWHVQADRTRLKQVLLNLLSNAVKYNRRGGSVSVVCEALPDQRLRISIRDEGEGLDAAQMEQLFQPFNRLGREGSDIEGTGIGLTVTKRLMELMGGSIGASSVVGQGSVFWLDLQIARAVQIVPLATPAYVMDTGLGAARQLRTLLYVEDNPANQALVREMIAMRPDLRLLTAPDAALGIELARAHRPDLILMDIHLPGMSGTEAAAILRQDPQLAHIPVIALSANAMPHDVAKGMRAGFFHYLTKPINVEEFFIVLDRALASPRAADPEQLQMTGGL
ncbi:MAG: MASE4 domain-containing protein [Pseudomonadota bacterium]